MLGALTDIQKTRGGSIVKKPLPTWVTTHKVCTSEDPHTVHRQLGWFESREQVILTAPVIRGRGLVYLVRFRVFLSLVSSVYSLSLLRFLESLKSLPLLSRMGCFNSEKATV